MTEEGTSKSLADELLEESRKPLTVKDRIVGLGLSVVFILLGIGMWIWPTFLSISTTSTSGRGARKIAWLMEIIWSRPLGALLILLGLLVIWGSLTKKPADSTA